MKQHPSVRRTAPSHATGLAKRQRPNAKPLNRRASPYLKRPTQPQNRIFYTPAVAIQDHQPRASQPPATFGAVNAPLS